MTTLHTGDKDEESLSAEDVDDVPEQPKVTENSADSADEPNPAEPNESSEEMERSLPAPTSFNANTSDLYTEWKHWMSAFKIYSIASGLAAKADNVQRATLLHCLGLVGPIDGKYILTYIDYYSSYPEACILKEITSREVIKALTAIAIFARFGYSEELVSDDGKQFISAEFEAYLKSRGIKHLCVSPYYARSNGKLERFY